MRLPRGLASFNRVVTNPVQGVYAWLVPPWVVIVHRGRRSGHAYRTPVIAFRHEGTLVVAMLYGRRSDWLLNLRAGGGRVVRGGSAFTVAPPRVVDKDEAAGALTGLSRGTRAYLGSAEAVAILEVGERLPGFGPHRGT